MKKLIFSLVLILLSVSIAFSGESFYERYRVDPTGLVLWLDQSDARSYGDASTWYDLSGKSNHGKQTLAPRQPKITGAAGFAGMARQFDGVDDYIEVADSNNISGFSAMTLAAWVNSPGTAVSSVVDKGGNAGDREYRLGLFNLNGAYDPDYIQVLLGDSGGAWDLVWYPQVTVPKDSWSHITVTWDGSAVIVYLDGVNVASTAKTGAIINGAGKLLIGATDTGGFVLDSYFNGHIPIVRIWNRALSAAEIQRLYLADAPRFGKLQ
jgi:hypothetical protein